jgi:MerR family copper efflux transcriptional regulator
MGTVREIFTEKLRDTQETITRLTRLAGELAESLAYLESCRSCSSTHSQNECCACDKHDSGCEVPVLVDGIAKHTP